MSERGRAVAVLAVLMAAGLGMALWGSRGPGKAKAGPVPQPVVRAVGEPGRIEPVAGEPPPVPDPPPGEDRRTKGWRYDGDSRRLLALAPTSVETTCGACHAVPAPDILPRGRWRHTIEEMTRLVIVRGRPALTEAQIRDAAEFYFEHSPAGFLPLEPGAGAGSVAWGPVRAGRERDQEPQITNVNLADLDGDGTPEVFACDVQAQTVSMIRGSAGGWVEETLAVLPSTGRTSLADADGDGDLDVGVAGIGSLVPTDEATGYATILFNDGPKGWRRRDILRDAPRLADLQPGDFDGDGDLDWSVACFGWRMTGFVGWLRNDGDAYVLQKIDERPGAIHAPVADLNGDGRLDIVAILAQEHEEVVAYLNEPGGFRPRRLFAAGNPLYGSSGLELVDLDRDGDLDVLFTNGDTLDDPSGLPKPYHGVQWLENTGDLEFQWREIGRCYGAYRGTAADLDGDGDRDVAVAVMFADWEKSKSSGWIWYENDGKQGFTRHDVEGAPDHMITLCAGDCDGDGDTDIVTGRLLYGASGRRADGIQLWVNGGRR